MEVFKKEWDNGILPTVKLKGDAGMDFYAVEDWIIKPHRYGIIQTGYGVIIPEGYMGLLKPKGSNQHMLGSGVVDSNYRGQILFKVWNTFDSGEFPADMVIRRGDAIGQMVILKCLDPDPVEEITPEEAGVTNRGATGGIVRDMTWD